MNPEFDHYRATVSEILNPFLTPDARIFKKMMLIWWNSDPCWKSNPWTELENLGGKYEQTMS